MHRAPTFTKFEVDLLATFVRDRIEFGDESAILNRIEESQLRPSKHLADELASMLDGNEEFLMIDEQKVVFEEALDLVRKSAEQKQVLLIRGGPGTGKSVVAVNLLVKLINQAQIAAYVTRNSAPREVYARKLTGTWTKTKYDSLFKSAGKFIQAETDSHDVLIVDEAHRLTEKSNFYGEGDNQIKEIINAGKLSVFFLDQDQRVHWKDIGDREEILSFAELANANVTELELVSQFRCNGSDGYLSWVTSTLQIEQTANVNLEDIDYDFQVFDSPTDMHDKIIELNEDSNRARAVAGYCWDWKGKRDASIKDIDIPEHAFQRKWNLDKDGMLWMIEPNSVQEIGCIHTCQGLELDYVGVIIGEDLVIRDGKVVTNALKRSSQDASIKGYKKLLKEDKAAANKKADYIIKNTYRTLMTRGQKACYLFCTDPETNEYFKSRIG